MKQKKITIKKVESLGYPFQVYEVGKYIYIDSKGITLTKIQFIYDDPFIGYQLWAEDKLIGWVPYHAVRAEYYYTNKD